MKIMQKSFLRAGIVGLTLAAITGCGRGHAPRELSAVNEVVVQGGTLDRVGVEFRASQKHGVELDAFFFYDENGERRFYEPVDGQMVTASTAAYGYNLAFNQVEIGQLRNGRLLLCDRYELGSVGTLNFACNAVFYNPGFELAHGSGSAVSNDKYLFDVSLAALPGLRLDSAVNKGTADSLERFAQNQINQYSTSTCAYNAATGIMETLYGMKTGTLTNFSEPFYLAYSPRFNDQTSWFWTMYERMNSETSGMLPDASLPVRDIYQSGVGFSTAKSRAKTRYEQSHAPTTRIPFEMKGTKIFFNAEWQGGYMKSTGSTTAQQFNDTVAWFAANNHPLNIHYWINGIWHSVIMIGYDEASNNVMIKDSLGNTNIKGTWKSRQWFLANVYAAIGVVGSGGAIGTPDTQTGEDLPVVDTQIFAAVLNDIGTLRIAVSGPLSAGEMQYCLGDKATCSSATAAWSAATPIQGPSPDRIFGVVNFPGTQGNAVPLTLRSSTRTDRLTTVMLTRK